MRLRLWVAVMVGCGAGVGCSDPSLDLPRGSRPALVLEFVPNAAAAAAVPLVFRGRIEAAVEARASVPFLFKGELSDYHQSSLRRGDLSEPLRARALPLRFWMEKGALLLQPQAFLAPGQPYTVALTGYGQVVQLRAGVETERWERLFPPRGVPVRNTAVYCGTSATVEESSFTLEPGAVPAKVSAGVFGAEVAECITITAFGSSTEASLPPPEVAGVPLEPSPFVFESAPNANEAAACASAHAKLAVACAEVLDDRVRLLPHVADLLWVLTDPQPQLVVSRRGIASTLLRGLAPERSFQLRGFVVTPDGTRRDLAETLRTAQARRHVVLNEVLADARGVEPESEWIEVVNDSATPVELLGLFLEDGGGAVPLPDVTLEPFELAVLLGEGYRDSGVDVAIPEGIRRIKLSPLGVRGLSNSGEALLLVGHEGVVSRFPMVASKRAGVSIARVDPAVDVHGPEVRKPIRDVLDIAAKRRPDENLLAASRQLPRPLQHLPELRAVALRQHGPEQILVRESDFSRQERRVGHELHQPHH